MVVSFALFTVALILLLAAVLSVIRARRVDQIAKVNERLEAIAFLTPQGNGRISPPTDDLMMALTRWLNRVGIPLSPVAALAIIALVTLAGLLVLKKWGLLAAGAWWGIAAVISVLIPQIRYRQKINQLIGQIPLFIDQVIRAMVTGRNVEGAIKLAAEDLQEPLRGVIMRAQNNVELGVDLGEAMRDAAQLHDVKELHMLALAIHTSRVYGGSPKEMLESIVNLIRQREQMQRELRAMTGETRTSAWILGLLPSLLALYMTWVNPDYITSMWQDPSGQNILLIALTLQILGGLLLWRMVKSV